MALRARRVTRTSILALLACGLTVAGTAPAEWPPPETVTAADMDDPQYWPNDPSYGYSDTNKGQWNYYSFIPKQVEGSVLRPEETASGMSIDLAWRWTQGDDSVVIAVTDSGIKWDAFDLLDRAWLNPGELATHKPTQADGSPCGGTGALEEFDCNGDGIFSVSDYAETPALQPAASEGHPLGDMNQNGHLDAGDLILNFSDGVDDDGNGYVDDISGWDFLKDDNNPYDDTRYGHGTGEANDAVATGNNGSGGIGGCPNCRYLPMRVGDSFITDVNSFAQSIIYATDVNASVIQCALGTVNMNRFAQDALDYAYHHNVLPVISMADENARHHNMPASANHTLPVHAITFSPGNKITDVQTYIDFNTCTNYGGQNFLSVSGEGCSSEAVGQLSGMSGLLYSAALKYGVTNLTAGEAMQLWLMTADDIYVPESEDPDSGFYQSQPGFDQRFGFGRTNANTAVEWVKDGKIPPAVDVTRPYWFEVLYRDQVSDAVPITGTISAKRATSYDYIVEWAPGVQPLDDAFNEIASETNVPSDVVTGEDGEPLAKLDIRTLDTTHVWDPDSPNGENQHTITVRIRVTAHYGGDIGDVPGQMRRTYYVHDDPALVKGFPIQVEGSLEGNPKMADLDGDGVRDLIYPTSAGEIMAYKITSDGPQMLPGFPFKANPLDGLADTPPVADKPNYRAAAAYQGTGPVDPADPKVDPARGLESFVSAPAIADVDGDGALDIVATTYSGTIYLLGADGQLKDGWPVRLPDIPSCPRDGSEPQGLCMGDSPTVNGKDTIDRGAFGSPVLADMDNDGDYDVVQPAFDGKVYVFDSAGQAVDGWPVTVHYNGDLVEEPSRGRVFSTAAVHDFNDDGYPEVVVGSNERLGQGEQAGAVYMIDGRGNNAPSVYAPNWPVTMTSLYLFPLVAEGVTNTAVIGNFDGTAAAVAHGNGSQPLVLPYDPGAQGVVNKTPPNVLPQGIDEETGEPTLGLTPASQFGELSKAFRPNTMFPLFGNPSVGDIDQDGTEDIIAVGSSLNLAINLQNGAGDLPGEHLLSVWSGKTGAMLPASPFLLEDYSFFNSQAIADLNGDDYPEVMAGTGGYFVHAFDGCGREPEGWPKFTGQWMTATPAVGDLDGDDKLEVVIGTRSGWIYAWHTEGDANGMVLWESYHHDNRNTGSSMVALDQGDPSRKAAEPLTLEYCKASTEVPLPLEPAGGCATSCAVGSGDDEEGPRGGLLLALLGLTAAARRRRRRRA